MAGNHSIQFMHQLNDGGLNFLNSYLEEQCECSVMHISPSGRTIYSGENSALAEQLKSRVKNLTFEGEYLYCREEGCMLYDLHVNEFRNRFVFFPLKERDCEYIIGKIRDIYVPVSYYVQGLYYSFGRYQGLMGDDAERIFGNDREYWRNLLASRKIDLAEEISVVVVRPADSGCDPGKLLQAMRNFSLAYGGMDILNYLHRGKIVQIVPARYKPLSGSGVSHVNRQRYPVYLLPEMLHDELGGQFTVSIGSRVKYGDMPDSYLHAMASQYYLEYFRKEDKVIHYFSVGPASRLLQTDLAKTEAYLKEKYSVLNKYENDHSGELLTTLRELVRNCFDYPKAAARVHIHLNTLYYRQDKLSGILGVNLGEMETKIVLYEELFAYDFINSIKEDLYVTAG